MNFQQLHCFVAVSRYLNFSEAAKHLYVAQSSLSHNIASLEEELKVKLFYRDTRSVKLTPAGVTFLKEVDEIINRMELAIEKTRKAEAGFSGQLRIGFLSSVIKRHFSEWIPPFQEKYPNVSLTIEQLSMAPLREALKLELIDIGFTRSFDLAESPDLQWIRIYDDEISLVLRKDHPLANSPVVDFKALAHEPFIILSPQTSPHWYNKVIQICNNHGFTPTFAHTPLSMEAVYTMLESGMGVSILPYSGNLFNMPSLKFIQLEGEDTKIHVVAAWKKSNLNPVIPIFLNEIAVHS